MGTRIILISALALAVGAGGCGGTDSGGRPTVVAAFYPLAFAAERVGGQRYEVVNITPPGAEPHDVELSARDVDRVRSAEVVLYLGGGFQPALEDALAGASGRAVDLLEGLPLLPGDEGADPHVWLDPLRFATMVLRIGTVLGAERRAGIFARRLRELHVDYREGLAKCARDELVTSHAAFGYLADRYRLQEVVIAGLTPEAEPTPGALERAVEEVRRSGATTVFFEPLVSPRVAETVARESGASTAVLDPLEGLEADALEDGADYLSVMRENLAAIRKALGCRPPSS